MECLDSGCTPFLTLKTDKSIRGNFVAEPGGVLRRTAAGRWTASNGRLAAQSILLAATIASIKTITCRIFPHTKIACNDKLKRAPFLDRSDRHLHHIFHLHDLTHQKRFRVFDADHPAVMPRGQIHAIFQLIEWQMHFRFAVSFFGPKL